MSLHVSHPFLLTAFFLLTSFTGGSHAVLAGSTLTSAIHRLAGPTGMGQEVAKSFSNFVANHNRSYDSYAELERRWAIFHSAYLFVAKANANNHSVHYELGKFADRSKAEREQLLMPMPPSDLAAPRLAPLASQLRMSDLPAHYDARDKGAVTPIKNQGACGSCWAYAAVAVVESQHAITKGLPNAIPLSEQELIDCQTEESYGCNGGYPDKALKYVLEHGLARASDYPYISRGNGQCLRNMSLERGYISSVHRLRDEHQAAYWLYAQGPFSVTMKVPDTLFYYKSGIYSPSKQECREAKGWHAMAAVAYGSDNGIPFWVVKNSWGEDYGNYGGYIMIRRGMNACHLGDYIDAAVG